MVTRPVRASLRFKWSAFHGRCRRILLAGLVLFVVAAAYGAFAAERFATRGADKREFDRMLVQLAQPMISQPRYLRTIEPQNTRELYLLTVISDQRDVLVGMTVLVLRLIVALTVAGLSLVLLTAGATEWEIRSERPESRTARTEQWCDVPRINTRCLYMLHLEHVRKTFGAVIAVDDLSVEIARGEVFGLLGPNGAGKSTTVHLAVGLLAPDRGSVSIDGRGAPTLADVRARIGVAPQTLSLYEQLSADENLRFFGRMYRLSGAHLDARVSAALDFVGLTERRKDPVRNYSGGMKRRLNLAAAILHEPDLILLDEPTVGVDPQSRNAIFDNILALKSRGRTIVYTTHYMEEAERLCDRVGIMDHGRMLALDTVPQLLATHGARPVLCATSQGREVRVETADPLAELNRLAAAGRVVDFRVERPTLEQVFLNLTGRTLRD